MESPRVTEGCGSAVAAEPVECSVDYLPVRRLEKQIVSGVGIEGRIEIDEIDALARDMLAQNCEIVAIKKRVVAKCF